MLYYQLPTYNNPSPTSAKNPFDSKNLTVSIYSQTITVLGNIISTVCQTATMKYSIAIATLASTMSISAFPLFSLHKREVGGVSLHFLVVSSCLIYVLTCTELL